MYIPLHGHSTFSFLESVGKPKDIVQKAKELGFSAIALTDIDVVYGLVQFYQAAKSENIKPILGTEVGFVMSVDNIMNTRNIGSLCLLAKNDQGYLNLLKIITYASQEGIARRPKIDFQVLEKYKEGLFCFFGGDHSWISAMISNSESQAKIKEVCEMLISVMGKENCFFEVIAQDERENPRIKMINAMVLDFSRELDIPCFVSNVYMYPSVNDKITHELAMAIKDNVTIFDPRHRVLSTKNHMMTEDEIRSICKNNGYSEEQIQGWIEQTEKIANDCNAEIEMGQKLFPKYEVEPEIIEVYEQYKDELIVEE